MKRTRIVNVVELRSTATGGLMDVVCTTRAQVNLTEHLRGHSDWGLTPADLRQVIISAYADRRTAQLVAELRACMAMAAGDVPLCTDAGHRPLVRPGREQTDIARAGLRPVLCVDTGDQFTGGHHASAVTGAARVDSLLARAQEARRGGLTWRRLPADAVDPARLVPRFSAVSLLDAEAYRRLSLDPDERAFADAERARLAELRRAYTEGRRPRGPAVVHEHPLQAVTEDDRAWLCTVTRVTDGAPLCIRVSTRPHRLWWTLVDAGLFDWAEADQVVIRCQPLADEADVDRALVDAWLAGAPLRSPGRALRRAWGRVGAEVRAKLPAPAAGRTEVRRWAVYELLNAAGEAVYCGCTCTPAKRLRVHRRELFAGEDVSMRIRRWVTTDRRTATLLEELRAGMLEQGGARLRGDLAGRMQTVDGLRRTNGGALSRNRLTYPQCVDTGDVFVGNADAELLAGFNPVHWQRTKADHVVVDGCEQAVLHGFTWRLLRWERLTPALLARLVPRPCTLARLMVTSLRGRRRWTVYRVVRGDAPVYIGITTGDLEERLRQHLSTEGVLRHRRGQALTIEPVQMLTGTLMDAYRAESTAIQTARTAGHALVNSGSARGEGGLDGVDWAQLTDDEWACVLGQVHAANAVWAKFERLMNPNRPRVVDHTGGDQEGRHRVCVVTRVADGRAVYVGRAVVPERLWTAGLCSGVHQAFDPAEGAGLEVHVVDRAATEKEVREKCAELVHRLSADGHPLRNQRGRRGSMTTEQEGGLYTAFKVVHGNVVVYAGVVREGITLERRLRQLRRANGPLRDLPADELRCTVVERVHLPAGGAKRFTAELRARLGCTPRARRR